MFLPCLIGLVLMPGALRDTVGYEEGFDERFPIELTGELVDDADGSVFMDALDWIRLHPYDLNRVTTEELLAVPGVTPAGAQAVQSFRDGGGKFVSPGDLREIPGGSEGLYEALLPFAAAGAGARRSAGERVLLRVSAQRRPPADGSSLGPPLQFTSRLTIEGFRGIEAGALFARRAGERTEDAFLSGYAVVRGIGCFTGVLAGDYDIEAGQGLVLWRGPTAVRDLWSLRGEEGLSIVPHRTSDQSHYMRGLALSFTVLGGWRGAVFVSDRAYGASVDSSGDAAGFFTGAYTTQSTAARKDALRERLIGFRGEYVLPGALSAGCTLYSSSFDRAFAPGDGMRLAGSRARSCGVDAAWKSEIASVRGEWGWITGGAQAYSWGLTLVPCPGQMITIHYRNYPPDFDNPHASGDSEGGETRNERGTSAAIRMFPGGSTRLECRVDAFEHPWPTSRNPIPRRGIELTLSAEVVSTDLGTLLVRCSRKKSFESLGEQDAWGRDIRSGGISSEERYRFEAVCPAGPRLRFADVIEFVRVTSPDGDAGRGVLLGGEICLTVPGRATLTGSFSLFHADAYSARLYHYESSLPGAVSIPPLYGRGIRWYLRARWSPAAALDITFRYAVTTKDPSTTGGNPFYDLPASSAEQIGIQADFTLR